MRSFSIALVVGCMVVGTLTVGAQNNGGNPQAAALKNPVPSTPNSIDDGRKLYQTHCRHCHGAKGLGDGPLAPKNPSPANLTDGKWDHGSTDGEIYTVIKRGIPPTMMAGWDGRVSDAEIWSIVNYLRALASKKSVPVAPPAASDPTAEHTLALSDYVQMPMTGEPAGELTRGLLARVNFLRDEPGGRRFFVNDLNGPLYILDKQTKRFTTYLDFNGLAGRPGLFQRLTFQRNLATGLINVVFDPDYARNGIFYTIHMEDPTVAAPSDPRPGAVPGLDLSGYRTTPTNVTPAVGAVAPPGTTISCVNRPAQPTIAPSSNAANVRSTSSSARSAATSSGSGCASPNAPEIARKNGSISSAVIARNSIRRSVAGRRQSSSASNPTVRPRRAATARIAISTPGMNADRSMVSWRSESVWPCPPNSTS